MAKIVDFVYNINLGHNQQVCLQTIIVTFV